MAIFSRAALDSRTLLRKIRDITAPLACSDTRRMNTFCDSDTFRVSETARQIEKVSLSYIPHKESLALGREEHREALEHG